MAKLPNKPFLFNYNALQYNAETLTLPKTKGQLFNQDLVFTQAPTFNAGDAYFHIGSQTGCNCSFDFSTVEDNPFNRDASNSTFTFIYKVASMTNTLFANRQNGNNNIYTYNYMVRRNVFHTSNSNTLNLNPPTGAYVMYIRVNADGTGEKKCITTNQTVTTNNINWGYRSLNANFFYDYIASTTPSEKFTGDFYWMYCSNEVLTDEEIQQVIDYNENPSSFSTTPDTLVFNYNGVSQNLSVDAKEGASWTATTIPSWIGLSQSEGTGATTVTVSANKNTSNTPRTGTIIFENSDGAAAEVSATQEKYPLIVPINNFKINRGGE